MKKYAWVLIVLFLLPLCAFGAVSVLDRDQTVSVTENRRLKTFPPFSVSALLSGQWTADLERYYADTFPLRERLLKADSKLNAFYVFSPFAGDSGEVSLVVSLGGDQLAHTDPTPTPTQEPEVDFTAGDVIVVGDRAMYTGWKNEKIIGRYNEGINALYRALGGVPLTCMLIPNAGAFYSPEEWRVDMRDQADIIGTAYAGLDEGIRTVDAYTALAAHTDQYIYFRTDHHWTQLGAYWGYTALCQTLGLTPRSQDSYATAQVPGDFLGSFYTLLSAYPPAAVLAGNPDTVEYWFDGGTDCPCTAYTGPDMTDGTACAVLYPDYQGGNQYEAFFGGDWPLVKVETRAKTGRSVLILKDSEANALIPFLLDEYDEIYIVDPRFFNLSGQTALDLPTFVEQQGIDQVMTVNGMGILNNAAYQDYLAALVPTK